MPIVFSPHVHKPYYPIVLFRDALVLTPPSSVLYKACLLLLRFGSKVSCLVLSLPCFNQVLYSLISCGGQLGRD
jgi:hypothetical protein